MSQFLNHEMTLRNVLLNNELYLVKKIGQRNGNDNPILALKDKNIRKQSDSQYEYLREIEGFLHPFTSLSLVHLQQLLCLL